MKTDDKKIYLVDSGLSFNLPFPLVLRPQRGIELYITFDFSSRKSDSTPPFRVSPKIPQQCNIQFFGQIKNVLKRYLFISLCLEVVVNDYFSGATSRREVGRVT